MTPDEVPGALTRLRAWREEKGWTLAEVSGLAGVSIAMLGQVERGERDFSAETKVLFARRLGAKVTDLFAVDPLPEAVG